MDKKIEKLRKDYSKNSLSEEQLGRDPLALFSKWFAEALQCGMIEPNAMALATAGADGAPAVRFVLLKGFDVQGFRFFTNLESSKGRELKQNPRAALAIYWDALERQVRITGTVERLSKADNEAYFKQRPRGAQIAACCSQQSRPMASPDELREKVERFAAQNSQPTIALPENWGGYLVIPRTIEFWKGKESRLHDRVRYSREENGEWQMEWLQP